MVVEVFVLWDIGEWFLVWCNTPSVKHISWVCPEPLPLLKERSVSIVCPQWMEDCGIMSAATMPNNIIDNSKIRKCDKLAVWMNSEKYDQSRRAYLDVHWVVTSSVKVSLSVVTWFLKQGDQGSINHTEPIMPCRTWISLNPLLHHLLLSSRWPMNGLVV